MPVRSLLSWVAACAALTVPLNRHHVALRGCLPVYVYTIAVFIGVRDISVDRMDRLINHPLADCTGFAWCSGYVEYHAWRVDIPVPVPAQVVV